MKITARLALATALAPLTLLLSACDVSLPRPNSTGSASSGSQSGRPNASIRVVNDGRTRFDQDVKNAIADVQDFWRANYSKISGGKPYPELRGGIYSVDGTKIPAAAKRNDCLRQDPSAAQNNAFYCTADDSVVYDRNPDHLVAQLAEKYGTFMITAVVAHEWGHAVQQRLGIFDASSGTASERPATIFTETQADCASGAFISTAQQGKTAHVTVNQQELEETLLGYLQVRDPPPVSLEQISHGNGFDRLSAMADGIANGVEYCFGEEFAQRRFTERPFTSDVDYAQRGNLPYIQIIDPTPDSADQSSLQNELNDFWTTAATSVDKPWKDVGVRRIGDPDCPAAQQGSEFDYCPDGNYVYFTDEFARQAYNSLPDKRVDRSTGRLALIDNAPADYSLGMLFVYGWSMAVREQLFGASIEGQDALLDASCYSGAFTASINDGEEGFQLSPPDMDEATSAVIKLVPSPKAYGAHETTALQRIQRFTEGYFGGLSDC
ncbi:MAG: neutral zinc metallopeptidase [Jatrophihabitantaceae bacterium]